MAILSDKTIKEYLEEGKIVIDSLKDEQQIQPSSVDMSLGDEFKVFRNIQYRSHACCTLSWPKSMPASI